MTGLQIQPIAGPGSEFRYPPQIMPNAGMTSPRYVFPHSTATESVTPGSDLIPDDDDYDLGSTDIDSIRPDLIAGDIRVFRA